MPNCIFVCLIISYSIISLSSHSSLFLHCKVGFLLVFILEPDVGMPQVDAQKYFRQIILGVVSSNDIISVVSEKINKFRSCSSSNILGGVSLNSVISGRKEGNVLFNDTLNTFYLRLYGIRHIVRGNPLVPHRLLFPISSKGLFICIIPQTG